MIQRIQTLFLGAITIMMSLNLFSPVWQASTKDKSMVLTPFYLYEKQTSGEQYHGVIYIAIVVILVIGLTIYSISQFKKRKLQIRLGQINSLLLCLVVLGFYLVIGKGKTMLGEGFTEQFELGFYLPLVSIICNLFSNRYIKKDEELVKSVDRIR